MSAASDLARQLKATRTGAGWTARCPAHDDRTASLSIGEGENGKLLVHCHAGCSFDAILKAAGLEPANPNGHDQKAGKRGLGKIVATYDYHDATDTMVFQVVRFEPKDFRQRRRPRPDDPADKIKSGPDGQWVWSVKDAEKVPYRLPKLLNASEVYICEGEKDCDNLAKLGLTATTNPGGADKDGEGGKKWPESFGRWFHGRHAILIPDNDESGRRHVQAVARKLSGRAASIRIIELPGLLPKGDVSDWLAAGGTREQLENMATVAPLWEPAADSAPDNAAPAGGPDPFPFTLLRDVEVELEAKFVIQDLVPHRALGEIYAPPGGGKTAVGVDMGLHIGAGRPYRGRRTEQQPVVYIALEGHNGINNRVAAARQHLGLDDQDIPFALIKIRADFRVKETAQRVAATVKAMAKLFGMENPNPVIFTDTFQAALGGGGNDCNPEHVTMLIENVKGELIEIGCTVIVVHHTGKDASKGSRGWSGLLGALDFELEIDRKKDVRFMHVSKQRDTKDEQSAFCYRLIARELGRNQYGEPVTAVVVEHLADAEGTSKGNKLSGKARAALNVLWELVKSSDQSWPLHGCPGMKCTMVGVWKKACIVEGKISRSKRERDRAAQFQEAKEELLEGEHIICDGQDNERVYPRPADWPDDMEVADGVADDDSE